MKETKPNASKETTEDEADYESDDGKGSTAGIVESSSSVQVDVSPEPSPGPPVGQEEKPAIPSEKPPKPVNLECN